MLRRLSLRARLTVLSVLLVGVGLVAAGIATRQELKGFLVHRVDEQLVSAEPSATRALVSQGRDTEFSFATPPHSFSALVVHGSEEAMVDTPGDPVGPLRSLAKRAPVGYSTDGGYRLLTVSHRSGPGTRLVIGIPLTDVNSTLNKLTGLELLIGLIVLGGVGGLAYALVRVELRPLRRIEDTAAAIAAGDLSRRVEEGEPTTEVGSLGASLNSMLSQIEASQDRLRRFVADASHELRTPLTSVRGYAELFRRGAAEQPEDLALVMQRIEAEAERMGVLVDDLLLLARLDQGRPLDRETVDLTALVTDAVSDFRAVDPGRPVSLDAPAPILVEGDEVRLRQVVGNLLTNARVHTPPGTTVRAEVSVEGETALLEVADDGPGLAPEQAERVFERFYRADTSRHHGDASGSGLGLSIVAAVVRAHGGEAAVSSAPGRGATFSIRLPLRPGDGGTHPEEERAEGRADGGEGSPGQGDDRAATGSQSAGRQA
ncbi:MAG: sensor histidine kinase [Solirubrobacteraceae bacterium]